MALIPCPECGNEISDKALMCPICGYSSRGGTGSFYCFEYVSKRKLFGLPLVHIIMGPALDPATGKMRVAKGIITIGGIAIGYYAIGGGAFGMHALGSNTQDPQLTEFLKSYTK